MNAINIATEDFDTLLKKIKNGQRASNYLRQEEEKQKNLETEYCFRQKTKL